MSRIVASTLSLVAMGASVLAGNDATTCLIRGTVAFIAGILLTQIWTAFFVHRSPVLTLVTPSESPVPAESNPEDVAA